MNCEVKWFYIEIMRREREGKAMLSNKTIGFSKQEKAKGTHKVKGKNYTFQIPIILQ